MTETAAETAELLSDLRATYGELFPHRDPVSMPEPGDTLLAMGILLRREQRLTKPLTKRGVRRLISHNRRDPE